MTRAWAILPPAVPVVASLGNPGLSLYNADPARARNFYFRNAMGSASSLALGLATAVPERRVVLLDGDGSLLMNAGSLATEGWRGPRNLVHICWDNRMYEMTGRQATATAGRADLAAMAEGAGFAHVERAETLAAFEAAIERALAGEGPWFIHAAVAGERSRRHLHIFRQACIYGLGEGCLSHDDTQIVGDVLAGLGRRQQRIVVERDVALFDRFDADGQTDHVLVARGRRRIGQQADQ